MRKDSPSENARKMIGIAMGRLFKATPDAVKVDGFTVRRTEVQLSHDIGNAYTFTKDAAQ